MVHCCRRLSRKTKLPAFDQSIRVHSPLSNSRLYSRVLDRVVSTCICVCQTRSARAHGATAPAASTAVLVRAPWSNARNTRITKAPVGFCRILLNSVDSCCFLVSLVSLVYRRRRRRATKRTHHPEAAFLCPTRPRSRAAISRFAQLHCETYTQKNFALRAK